MTENTISLVDLSRILREEFDIVITYRRLYGLILDGRIPAKKDPHSGRWLVENSQVSFIANGIEPPPIVLD